VLPKMILRVTGPLVLCLGSCPMFAQQFSAEMVREKPEGVPASKVAVSGEKMRFEITGKQNTVAIVDLKQESGFMILPDNKSYTRMPGTRLSTAMPFFRPTDPENACPAWDAFVGKPGSCSKVGDATVDSRDAVKYKGVARNGSTGFAYVDRKLDFVTKWESDRSVVSFKNIAEGPQASSLFTIPAGMQETDSLAAHQQGGGKPKKPKGFPAARPVSPPPAPQSTPQNSQSTPQN
jgi:hypothetical protein